MVSYVWWNRIAILMFLKASLEVISIAHVKFAIF